MRSLLNEVIKNRITNNKTFCLDKASQVWHRLTPELQAVILRGANIVGEPTFWGGYNSQQKRIIKNTLLLFEDIVNIKHGVEYDAKILENRINRAD